MCLWGRQAGRRREGEGEHEPAVRGTWPPVEYLSCPLKDDSTGLWAEGRVWPGSEVPQVSAWGSSQEARAETVQVGQAEPASRCQAEDG